MKLRRGGFREGRRKQILDNPRQDSYRSTGKLHDPTSCPECGATYQNGRWTWAPAPGAAREALCPACRRVHDHFPAGYVTLSGDFLAEHRDDVLQLVRHCEEKEKAEHALQRIMTIVGTDGSLLITTTDSHLARRIAEAVHDAYKGDIELRYGKEDNLLRASVRR